MDARKLANYLIALQELGGLSWDSQVSKIDPVQAIIMALDLYERYEGMNH